MQRMQQNLRSKNHRLQFDKNTTARLFSDVFGAANCLCFTAALGAALSPTLAQAQPFAYITNQAGGTVSVIDTSTNTVIDTVTVPAQSGLRGVAVTPDGAFVYEAEV
jgi:YVTN family beta-propeller protein